jgi:diadenosine tetraphosphate (Ap4A) HIT family hydrolase
MAEDWRADRVGSAERGENPMVMARMRSGFAVIADTQVLPGYCLLLGAPKVGRLESLSRAARNTYLEDLGLLAEAVDHVCQPKRLNLAILGNLDAYLHAHVIPRYDWEPKDQAVLPIWSFPEVMNNPAGAYDHARHMYLRDQITEALTRIMGEAGAEP